MKPGRSKIETTLSEMMKVASRIAFEQSDDTVEAHVLTSMIVFEMFRRRFAPASPRGAALREDGKISLN